MYIVDSHCDSIQQVDSRNFPLVNPYNMSQKYKQLQMVAMFCSWPHETPAECYKRTSRYMGLFSIAMDNESDKRITNPIIVNAHTTSAARPITRRLLVQK